MENKRAYFPQRGVFNATLNIVRCSDLRDSFHRPISIKQMTRILGKKNYEIRATRRHLDYSKGFLNDLYRLCNCYSNMKYKKGI